MKIKTTTTTETEVTEFPSYFRYRDSDFQFAKALNANCVIYAMAYPHDESCGLTIRSFLTEDYQPAPAERFYEVAAEAMRRINDGCNIITLELEGGAYAD